MAEKTKKMEADVAIIGGGPGGCTLAKELSAKDKKVVLAKRLAQRLETAVLS